MEIKTIDECFYSIRNGANIKQGVIDGGYPITRIETIANDRFNRDRVGYAGITELPKYESYVLQDGDLLMSHINSVQYLGRTIEYKKIGDETIIHGMNLLLLKANRSIILPTYAQFFFKSPYFKGQLANITKKSVNQASFNVKDLKRIKVSLPTVDEQSKVVDKLLKIRSIIEQRQQELDKLDELVKARFVEMFGDAKLNPNGYPIKALSEISVYWNGLTYKPEDVSEKGTIVLRSSNIQNSRLDFDDVVRVSCKIGEKKFVQENDVLMCSRNGSARLVGKVALIKEIIEPMSFGAFMMIIRSQYYPYLLTYFQMPAFREQIATGATTTINQITTNMLNKVKLPVPNVDTINQFANFVKQIDKSKFIYQKNI